MKSLKDFIMEKAHFNEERGLFLRLIFSFYANIYNTNP